MSALTITLTVLAVLIPLGAWIGIRIAEANEELDRDLADLVMSTEFLDGLNTEANRWQR